MEMFDHVASCAVGKFGSLKKMADEEEAFIS